MFAEKEHLDITVLELRKQFKERSRFEEEKKQLETKMDICSGKALIREEIVVFEKMLMMEKNISMMVPEGMIELPEEAKLEAYEGEYQPQFVYVNHDGSLTIFFDALFEDVDEESFELVRREMIRDFRQELDNMALVWKETKNRQGECIYYFINKKRGECGVTYNITFEFLVRGFLVMGSLTLMGHRIKDWKEAVFQMIESLIIEEEPEQEVV